MANKNRRIRWVYFGFFAVLLTVFLWVISREQHFSDSRLTVINPLIPDFKFTNQDNKLISPSTTANKVYVAEYFFTTCKGICPKMNANMRRVYDMFRDETDFMILSHTCMPENDSVPVLKSYEHKMINGKLIRKDDGAYKIVDPLPGEPGRENTSWHFVTGDKTMLYMLARKGYMIDNGKPDSTQRMEDQFIHTQFFALVDRYGRVRGIYDGLKEDEVQKLMKDIPGLLKERVEPGRFLNGFSNNPG